MNTFRELFTPNFKRNWAYYLLLFEIVLGIAWVTWLGSRGHYHIYTEPAKLLWAFEDPYDRDLPNSPGHYYHSPSCALFYFSLFAFLPPRLGQCLYVTSTIGLFLWGLLRLTKQLKKHLEFDLFSARFCNLLFLMIGSEIVGAVAAVKIEPLFVGMILLLASYFDHRKIFLITIGIAGFMASWKLHPIAIIGLMLIPSLLKFDFLPAAIFGIGILFGWGAPYLVLPSSLATSVNQHWILDLNAYMVRDWKDRIFQHLPGFLYEVFQLDLGATTYNRLAVLVGISFAGTFAWWWKKTKPHPLEALLLAMGVGSAYSVLFALLIQSNSYAAYLPLVIAIVIFANRFLEQQRLTLLILIFTYFLISIAYSDLCPRDLRNYLYDLKLKPLGVLIQLVYLSYLAAKLPPPARES